MHLTRAVPALLPRCPVCCPWGFQGPTLCSDTGARVPADPRHVIVVSDNGCNSLLGLQSLLVPQSSFSLKT